MNDSTSSSDENTSVENQEEQAGSTQVGAQVDKETARLGANMIDEVFVSARAAEDSARASANAAVRARMETEKKRAVIAQYQAQSKASLERVEKAEKRVERMSDRMDQIQVEATAYANAEANAQAQGGEGGGADPQGAWGARGGGAGGGLPMDSVMGGVAQLTQTVIGTSPAFAAAMKLQADAIASGLTSLNAVQNQQGQYTLGLAATARSFSETHKDAERVILAELAERELEFRRKAEEIETSRSTRLAAVGPTKDKA